MLRDTSIPTEVHVLAVVRTVAVAPSGALRGGDLVVLAVHRAGLVKQRYQVTAGVVQPAGTGVDDHVSAAVTKLALVRNAVRLAVLADLAVAVGVGRIHVAVVGHAVRLAVLFALIRDAVGVAVRTARTNRRDLALVRDAVGLAILRGAGGHVALIRYAVAVAVLGEPGGDVALIRDTVLVAVWRRAGEDVAEVVDAVGVAVIIRADGRRAAVDTTQSGTIVGQLLVAGAVRIAAGPGDRLDVDQVVLGLTVGGAGAGIGNRATVLLDHAHPREAEVRITRNGDVAGYGHRRTRRAVRTTKVVALGHVVKHTVAIPIEEGRNAFGPRAAAIERHFQRIGRAGRDGR